MRMILPLDSVAQYVERNADEMTDCKACAYRGPLMAFARDDPRRPECPKCGQAKEIEVVL